MASVMNFERRIASERFVTYIARRVPTYYVSDNNRKNQFSFIYIQLINQSLINITDYNLYNRILGVAEPCTRIEESDEQPI